MNYRITCGQAEVRIRRAFRWLMATEPLPGKGDNPRWETFRKIRDRLRPYRMPLRLRLDLALAGLAGKASLDEETTSLVGQYRDMRTHGIAPGGPYTQRSTSLEFPVRRRRCWGYWGHWT